MVNCNSCNAEESRLNNELYLCKDCFTFGSGKLITKTGSMREYMLTDNDLVNLKSAKCRNNHCSGMETTLYLISDIELASTNKHGGVKKMEDKKLKLETKREQKKKLDNERKEYRRKELDDYIKSLGMAGIRGDSALCENFIEKGENSGYTAKEIGDILSEMEFYYKKTEYSSILKRMRDDEIQNYHNYYEFRRYHTDEDEEFLRQRAKDQALRNYVKEHYLDPRDMLDVMPYCLRDNAQKYSDIFYKTNNNKINNNKTNNNKINNNTKNILKNMKKIIKTLSNDMSKNKYEFKEWNELVKA